jgi:hypothetical protein
MIYHSFAIERKLCTKEISAFEVEEIAPVHAFSCRHQQETCTAILTFIPWPYCRRDVKSY